MKKIFLALLIVLFVISFVALVRLTPKTSGNVVLDNAVNVVSDSVVLGNGISLESLSKHNSESDCWIAYDGKVYDITEFLPVHAGGKDRIIPYCGTADEFQNAFTKKHGTSKVKMLMNVGAFMGDFEVKGNVNGN